MMKVSKFISELIPYVAGKPIEETKRQYQIDQVHKLASNENPLGPSPKALEAARAELSSLNLYPDAGVFNLKKKFSTFLGVGEDQLAFGNGSDELVDILVRIYCEAGDKILTSELAFDTYRLSAQTARCTTDRVPVTPDYRFDLKAMASALTPQHKIVFLTNPNNPTGTYFSAEEFDNFLKALPLKDGPLLVVDEAYFEFARAADYPNTLPLISKYPQLVVLRTMSKIYGLAGLRLGYMVACAETAGFVNKVRKPFNVNSVVQAAACAALEDLDFVNKTRQLTWQGLDYFYKQLEAMGFEFLKSQGNFVLVDMGQKAAPIFETLLTEGLIVRPVANYGLPYHLRISVGTMEQNEKVMKALAQISRRGAV